MIPFLSTCMYDMSFVQFNVEGQQASVTLFLMVICNCAVGIYTYTFIHQSPLGLTYKNIK